ncbi:MAG TPA: MFS transporter, partial [Terrimesophilobacter sp.]|nr:MFS transporter [Terrimesophilobacter sp.]
MTAALQTDRAVILWRNALIVVFGVCGLSLGGWMARMPAIKQALGIDTAQTGLVISALAIGSVLGLAFAGMLVSRFGARIVIAMALVGVAVGLVIAGGGTTLGSFWATYAGFLVYGAMLGVCDVAMNVSGALNERALGKTFMPVLHAFFSIGALVGAGVGALTESLGAPLLAHAGLLAVGILLLALFAVRHIRSGSSEPSTEKSKVGLREIWGDPRTYFIGLIVLGMALAEGSATD